VAAALVAASVGRTKTPGEIAASRRKLEDALKDMEGKEAQLISGLTVREIHDWDMDGAAVTRCYSSLMATSENVRAALAELEKL
jgi:hypothetical protein